MLLCCRKGAVEPCDDTERRWSALFEWFVDTAARISPPLPDNGCISPIVTPKTPVAIDEVVAEPILSAIRFRTKRLAWYMRYIGPGTVLEFFLLAPFIAYEYLRPARRTDTEARLNYSGPIYCARTAEQLIFIAHQEDARQTARVVRRFPSSELSSCDYEQSHATAVKFQFESGETLTLHFEGLWSELDDFINRRGSVAKPTGSRG